MLGACTPKVEKQLTTSREAIQQLGSSLKSTLKNTLQKSGPIEAISVCNIEAPKITTGISNNTNVQIGRTSLKLRNPQNAPDAWEQKQLEEFQNRFDTGTDITNLEFYEVIKADTGKWFRYMKAIPAATSGCEAPGSDSAVCGVSSRGFSQQLLS